MWPFTIINNRLLEIISLLRDILKVLRLRKPGLVLLKLVGESDMLQFKLLLPPPGAKDVVERKLSVSVNGSPTINVSYPGSATESEVIACPDDAEVNGTLVDIDDRGNQSPASEFSFVVTDTIAPPKPGEIGLQVVAEVDDPPPQEEGSI